MKALASKTSKIAFLIGEDLHVEEVFGKSPINKYDIIDVKSIKIEQHQNKQYCINITPIDGELEEDNYYLFI